MYTLFMTSVLVVLRMTSSQQIAGWVMLALFSAALFALAVGIYYWKKQNLHKQHVATTSRTRHPTFETMTSSELNRASNVRNLSAPERDRTSSTGYDAPFGRSHMEVSEFQPQQLAPASLKVDQQMAITADASLFENPYFADREFDFPKISHQSSNDVYADDTFEIDDSYIEGVKIKGITSTESMDHDDPRRPRPVMTSSSDYQTSELVLADDDEDLDVYIEGKLDLGGITTEESSDDPKEMSKSSAKRKISAGSLKLDVDMREARRYSADPDSIRTALQQGARDNDNDLVIINKSDLHNNGSNGSSGELSPSFETIDMPSIMVTDEIKPGSSSVLDQFNMSGFGSESQSSKNPFQTTQSAYGAVAPISDTSLGSDISVIAMGKNELGEFNLM